MPSLEKTEADLKLRQAEQAYRVLNYQKAIEALTAALDIVEDYQLYTFRSKCYTAASYTQHAIQDANTAICMQKEAHEGYFCRAEAEFFQGEFERALVDYSICQFKRPDISDHERGISKCEESIRKACECERVAEYIEWLDEGVFVERSLFTAQEDIEVDIFSGDAGENDSECSTGLNTATLFNEPEPPQETSDKFAILNVPSDKVYREINKNARRSQSYNRIGEMALDREFLKEVGTLNTIKDISRKGIDYIDQREEFWRNQSASEAKTKQFRRNASRSTSVGVISKMEKIENETARYRRKIAANISAQPDASMKATFYQRAIRRNATLEQKLRELSMFIKEANINITEAVNKQAYELAVQFCNQLINRLTDKNNDVLPLFEARLSYLADTYCIKACLEIKLQAATALETFDEAVEAAEESADTHILFKINREYGKALMGMKYYKNALTQLKQLFSYTQDEQLEIDLNYNLALCYFELKEYRQAADAGERAYQSLSQIFHDQFPETEIPAIMEFIIFREPRVCDIACDLLCLLGRTYQELGDPRSTEYLQKCCTLSRLYEDIAALRAAETALEVEDVQTIKSLPEMLKNDLKMAEEEEPENIKELLHQQINAEELCSDEGDIISEPHSEDESRHSENPEEAIPQTDDLQEEENIEPGQPLEQETAEPEEEEKGVQENETEKDSFDES